MFDALKHSDELKAVDFTESQARAVLNLVQESTEHNAASKADLLKTESKLKENINTVKEDLLKTEGRLKENIAEVRTEFKENIANSKISILKWMFGIAFTQTALLVGIITLLNR